MSIKEELLKSLNKQLGESVVIEQPQNPAFGDFAIPCFKLSKKPEDLKKTLKLPKFIERAEVKGPYLNLFINKEYLAEHTINEVIRLKEKYGTNNLGKGKKALVEHTSINPNASPHMGRARNAILGDSIVRILRFEGYGVETHYYVNDIGKQIAMLVLACKGKKPTFKQLLDLYIGFNKEIESNPSLEKEVFGLLNKLESRDQKTIKAFKEVVQICIKGQVKILEELDIKFDSFDYESTFLFNKDTNKILADLEKTDKVFVDEEKRKVINLEGFNLPMENPYLPLTRNDGTSLYLLRDLAYTIWKDRHGKDRNVFVLGEDQKLYFLQLKAILSLLKQKVPEVVHYSFILLPTGKMSTRKGEVILLEDFMTEVKEKAKVEIIKRHGEIKNIDQVAKIIGYGAIKFGILRISADKNIIFDLEKALSFEGETGPYTQYAHARACSILAKAKVKKPDYSTTNSDQEQALISKISNFPEVVKIAAISLQPHIVASYCLALSKQFNEFYHACPVLEAPEPLKSSRLKIVFAAKQTMSNALSMLGIIAPEKM